MITFHLNNDQINYSGDEELSLLDYLREEKHITSVKDGCSAEGSCGACLVEIDGKPRLSCTTRMKSLGNSKIFTLEGIPENIRQILAKTFVEKGAVQCGFCTPGFVMRTKILLQDNPNPSLEEIQKAIKLNLCRCTGYKKIEKAISASAINIKNNFIPAFETNGDIGKGYPKYQAVETALGNRAFTDDLYIEGMLHAALKFSDHPRAVIKKIDISEALQHPGVMAIYTAKDIPGKKNTGLIYPDWPLMIAEGETCHYIGDVLAGVVATSKKAAREAVTKIKIDYDILPVISDVYQAIENKPGQVHENHINVLDTCKIRKGNAREALEISVYSAHGIFETQRIEHAFLEKESALAIPEKDGLILYSQGQGIYEDRRQVASILNIPEEKIRVVLMPCGGGFGGKEDLTVQGHVSLFAWLLQKPVKLTLSRSESIQMHPKRHPVYMDMTIACDKNGKLSMMKFKAVGDTGAYASVGTKVMERVAGHATGGYYFPVVELDAITVYTNNIPCGAMRGFGVNQAAFGVETLIDELCEKGNFDRWKFRYENALTDGLSTATGQKLQAVGIRACLEALKEEFYKHKFVGLATGIKNSGIGNGMVDSCDVIIEIQSEVKVLIHHGWTEMGQGVQNVAIQTLVHETGINPAVIEVIIDTSSEIKTGMTTSSRATVMVGNALKDACINLKAELKKHSLHQLIGKTFQGRFVCDWTTKPGSNVAEQITHYSYGYAAQLAVLDEQGKLKTIFAAHDAGKIMNPVMFEGQIEGAVHMGTGYALTEDLPMKNGHLISNKLRDCGVLRAHETPEIVVIGVEIPDPVGPYGAKGLGEIGLVPTAPAISNAMYQFDKIRRYKLPLARKQK